jgi:hypothetical protein
MRLIAVAIIGARAVSVLAADAKSECIKALVEAKKAGLPMSIADMGPRPSEKGHQELAKELEVARRIWTTNEKRRMQLATDYSDTKVLKRIKSFGDVARSDTLIQSSDRQLLESANRIIRHGWRPKYDPTDDKMKHPEAVVRAMIRIKMDDANRAAASGNLLEVIKGLHETRKLPTLALTNSKFMTALMAASLEKSYYQYLLKLVDKYPAIGRQLPYNVLAPLPMPSVKAILREEFFYGIRNGVYPSQPNVVAPGFSEIKIPKDRDEQELFAKVVKNFTAVYKKCGDAKDYGEANSSYQSIKKDLDFVISEMFSKGEKNIVGPYWVEWFGDFDRILQDRVTIIKKMGIKKSVKS